MEIYEYENYNKKRKKKFNGSKRGVVYVRHKLILEGNSNGPTNDWQ